MRSRFGGGVAEAVLRHRGMPTLVRDLMTADVETLGSDETLDLASWIMQLGRIRHLPVVSASGALVGLVTHRDLLKASVERRGEVRVAEVMSQTLRTIAPEAPAAEAARILLTYKLGCLPVVAAGRLVGILTEADFVQLALRTLIEDR